MSKAIKVAIGFEGNPHFSEEYDTIIKAESKAWINAGLDNTVSESLVSDKIKFLMAAIIQNCEDVGIQRNLRIGNDQYGEENS